MPIEEVHSKHLILMNAVQRNRTVPGKRREGLQFDLDDRFFF